MKVTPLFILSIAKVIYNRKHVIEMRNGLRYKINKYINKYSHTSKLNGKLNIIEVTTGHDNHPYLEEKILIYMYK